MLPVSGYQPQFSMASDGGGAGQPKPADGARNSYSLPFTQVNDSPRASTSSPAPGPRPPVEPPKKKRKKDEVVGTPKAKPMVKKDEVPTVYFSGVEKPREDQAVKEVERPREQADAGIRSGQTTVAAPRRKPGDTESMRGSMRSDSEFSRWTC